MEAPPPHSTAHVLSPNTNTSSMYSLKQPETTTSGSSSQTFYSGKTFGLNNKCALITLIIFTILFLGILIVGALLPTIVWNVMADELHTKLVIGNDTYTERSWGRFLNSSTYADFYIYNLTNLNEVLDSASAKPNFQVVGPISFKKWYTKFELEWNSDSTLISYYEARNYEPLNDSIIAMLDQEVVTINTIYLGGMGQVMRTIAGPILNGHQPGYFPNGLNEQYFYGGVVTSSIFPTLASQLLNSSSTLTTALRLGSVKVYFGWSLQNLEIRMNLTSAQIVFFWANASNAFQGTQYNGMSLLQPLPELDKAGTLVSPANPYSFMNPIGNSMWIAALAGNTTLRNLIIAGNNISVDTYSAVATWIGYVTSTANFTTVVLTEAVPFTIQSILPEQPNLLPTTWAELSLLQFATGLVLNVTSSGIYHSVIDMLGPSAGLLAATNVPKAPEFAIGAQQFCSFSASALTCVKAANAPIMTLPMATSLVQFFSGAANPNALVSYLSLAPLLTAIINSPDMEATYSALLQNATYAPLLSQRFIADANGNNAGQLYAYLYGYLGTLFTGSPANRDALGLAPENGGLFFRTTIRSILFGVNADGTPALTAQNSQMRGVTLGNQLGLKPFDQYLTAYKAQYLNRKYIVHTGRINIYNVGQYEAFQGVSSFQFNCELVDPFNLTVCATPAGRAANDWQIYGQRENLVGTSNNLQTVPLAVRNQDPIPTLGLFIPEISRDVYLNYTSDRTVKDIDLRTYTIDMRHLFINAAGDNATTNPLKNEPRYYTSRAPDGISWAFGVFGGAPLALTLPQMYLVDPNVTSRITGLNPDPEKHQTTLSIEPITGLAMQAQKRLQSNFRVTRGELNWNRYYDNFFVAAGNDEVYVPYYYVDEHNTIEDQDADYYKDSIAKPLHYGDVFQIVGCVVGGFLFLVTLALLCLLFRKSRTDYSGHPQQYQVASASKV